MQINSSELTKPRIVMEACVGIAENALKMTYGCGTGPIGASIKAYRPEGSTLNEVGRLMGGVSVEVANRSVSIRGGVNVPVTEDVVSTCKAGCIMLVSTATNLA